MNRWTRMRRWIEEEKNYLWILITLTLVHATLLLLETLTAPLSRGGPPQEQVERAIEEGRFMAALKQDPSLELLFGMGTVLTFFILSLGLFLSMRFLQKKIQGRMSVPWRLPDQEILWTLRDVFHVAILIVLGSYSIEFFQAIFFHLLPWKISESIRILVTTLLTDLVGVCLVFRLVSFERGQSLSHLGLSGRAFSRNLFFGMTTYTTLLPFLAVALFISLWLADLFKLPVPEQPLYDLFTKETSRSILWAGLFSVILVGPLIEEIFFRGFLYNALKMKWGKGWAIFLSGFFFATLHANLIGLLPITLLGCVLAYGYELTGSLVTSITIHTFHNALVMAMFFFTHQLSQFFGVF